MRVGAKNHSRVPKFHFNQHKKAAKARLPTFSHNLHLATHYIFLSLNNIHQITTCRLFDSIQLCVCFIPSNAPHFFVSTSAIPVNRYLTECDFIRENPPSHGQVVHFKQFIREAPPVYGQTEHLESTFYSNKVSWWQAGQAHTAKSKHPCRLTEVSEAEQQHRPLRIVSLPRIIRLTQSSSTSHGSKGCAQMSFTATRLPP